MVARSRVTLYANAIPPHQFMKANTPISTVQPSASTALLVCTFIALLLATAQAQIGKNWRMRNPQPWGDTLNSAVATTSTHVVAAGLGTAVLISDDAGMAWSASRIDPAANFFNDAIIAWNQKTGTDSLLLLAVANVMFTSDDEGVSWTAHKSDLDSYSSLRRLIWNGSQWVAIEFSGVDGGSPYYLSKSTDGQHWTRSGAIATLAGFPALNDLVWTGSAYIIGGSNFNSFTGVTTPYLLRSTDGINWTNHALTGVSDSTFISSVVWSGSKLVAVGNVSNAYTSTDDGATWTRQSMGTTVQKVGWNGSKFVGVGYDSNLQTVAGAYSSDGAIWTLATTPPPDLPQALTTVGTTMLGVGANGSIFSSSNGDGWTRRSPTGPIPDLAAVAANPSGVIVAGGGLVLAGSILRSTNSGDSWTEVSSTFVNDLVWDPAHSTFVGVDGLGSVVSSDGGTWSSSSAAFGSQFINRLAYGNSTLVAVGTADWTNGSIWTSTDGANSWTNRTLPANTMQLRAIAYIGAQWVAVGDAGTILTSTNSTTWTKRTVPGAAIEFACVAGNSTGTLFVAMGIDNATNTAAYATSTNGTTWVRRVFADNYNQMISVVWTGTNFAAIDSNHTAYVSTDAVNWTKHSLPTSSLMNSLGWDAVNKQVLAVGSGGIILSSDAIPDASFAIASQSVFESAGTVAVQVNLSSPAPVGGVTVPFVIDGSGTAASGSDYTAIAPLSLSFLEGETSRAVSVSLINDGVVESDKTIIFRLGSASGIRLGTQVSHTLTITDEDGPPIVQFDQTAVAVPERFYGPSFNVAEMSFMVVLDHPAPAAMTVPFTITGAASADVTGTSPVAIPAGASCAFVKVLIHANASNTADEIASITLGAPSIGSLGSNQSLAITIKDQDLPGSEWTLKQPFPAADRLWAIASIPVSVSLPNGRQVAVGDGGVVVTSDNFGNPDPLGNHWTRRFTSVNPEVQYTGVHWNTTTNMLVAAGNEGHVGVSPDGLAWGDVVVPDATDTLAFNSIANNATRTVMVGSELSDNTSVPRIYTSQDFVHWSQTSLPPDLLGDLRSVVCMYLSNGGSEFVAVGSNYNFTTQKAETLILTSFDGLSWTNCSAALAGIDLSSIKAEAYGSNKFIAFDGSKTTYTGVITPATGAITWTPRVAGSLTNVNSGAWNGSKLATVGALSTLTGTTVDNIAWVSHTTPSTSKRGFNDITWTGSNFIALADPAGFYTSPDGAVWTKRGMGAETTHSLLGVVWGGTKYVAVGGDFDGASALVLTSPNAETWTPSANTLKHPLAGVAWNGSVFCAVGFNGTIATSADGVAWTTRAAGLTNLDLKDVIWQTNQFVVVGGHETGEDDTIGPGGSIVLTSKDGTTWVRRTIPTNHPLEGIAYGSNTFVAVGRATFDGGADTAEVLTSPDAITWTHRSSGHASDWQHITFNGGRFVVTNDRFGIYHSPDGIAWTPASTQPPAPPTDYISRLRGVTWAGGRFVAVGSTGSIVTSVDGDVWRAEVSNMKSGALWNVAASPYSIVAVGDNGSVQTSNIGGNSNSYVDFALANSSVSESAGIANILVTLSPPSATKVTVAFHPTSLGGLVLTGSTADVTVPASPLVFNPGETSKHLSIIIKNDLKVDPGKALVLTLDSVTSGVAFLGSTHLTHTLTIADDDTAPTVGSVPSQLVRVGESVALSVSASGTPPLTYQWKKNNAAVAATVTGGKSPTLYIDKAALTDGGTYTCTVSNPVSGATGVTTAPAQLGVYEHKSAAISVAGLGTGPVVLTQPASANCTFKWFKNSAEITTSLPVGAALNTSKSALTLTNLTANNGTGTYQCDVSVPGLVLIAPSGDTFNVSVVSAVPAITPVTALSNGVIGNYYSQQLVGTGVSTWSCPDFAALGLRIDPDTGLISGYPTATATNKVVTITATNGKGSTSIKPTLTITSAITPFLGTHTGLLDRDSSNNNLGGIITITVATNGTFTGKYTVGTTSTSITGTVNVTGANTFNALATGVATPHAIVGNTVVSLDYSYDNSVLNSNSGSGHLSIITPPSSTPVITSFKCWQPLTSSLILSNYVGRHNFALRLGSSGDLGNAALPQGHGFGSATVTKSGTLGNVTYAGQTGDGTVITASSPVNIDGSSVLYASLYTGRGSLVALPKFAIAGVDTTLTDLTGTWSKLPDVSPAGARTYPAGWAPITVKLEGTRYSYLNGDNVTGFVYSTTYPYNNAVLSFVEGGLQASSPFPDVNLNVMANGTIDTVLSSNYGMNPRALTFKLTPSTGVISGTLNMNETLSNGYKLTKRGAIAYNGQLVRVYDSGTSSFTMLGVGNVLLPQLPDLNISPMPSEITTPILSGKVELTATP